MTPPYRDVSKRNIKLQFSHPLISLAAAFFLDEGPPL